MRTEDQLRAEYVVAMGPDLGQWYYELERELDWPRQKWSVFQDLFDKGSERIEMLNTVASNFFHILHRFLFEDAMLHLCRLTDPPKTGSYQNLTMMSLSERISEATLKASVSTAADRVKKGCEFARQWRHKRLAHTDLEVFRTGNTGLPAVESKDIENALLSMSSLLNLIREHYDLSPAFLGADSWGAEPLIRCLEEGVRATEKGDQFTN